MYDSPRIRRVRFYKTPAGKPVAREEFFDLEEAGQAALGELFTRYEHGLERRGEVLPVREGLLEFRTRVGNDPYRAYFFQDGPKYVIVTLCTYKNRKKASKGDIEVAKSRMKSWKARRGSSRSD